MKKALGFILLMILVLSCTDRVGFFGEPTRKYNKTLNKWTQEKSFFTIENTKYLTSVTYKTEDFRRAYVDEFADLYRLSPEKKEEMLKHELSEAKDYDAFVVSNFSTEKGASKITADPKVWGIFLSTTENKDDGIEPKSVSSLPRGDDPVFSHFYPYVSIWSSNYLVLFKKLQPSDALYLHLTGVLGDVTFKWKNPS